jgi:protein-S-isoprenylcysteine O-methyltransferase Ste14
MRFFLLTVFIVAFLLLILFPAWRVYKQTGIFPIRTKNTRNVYEFTAAMIKYLWGIPFISVLLHAFCPACYAYLMPMKFLRCPLATNAGVGFIIFGILFTAVAQHQMGRSWRIGIDEENKTALIETGLYHFTRNPIYLGLMIVLIGLFLVLPDVLTFATLITTYVGISIQIRLEEEFLTAQHGPSFLDYMKRVRRWI